MAVSVDKYTNLLKRLIPTGWAWRKFKEQSSTAHYLMASLSPELARAEEESERFFNEVMPEGTFDLLIDWERLLALPDECTQDEEEPSLYERRVRVLQKLSTKGGQNIAFYILIAEQLGYDISVIDVEDFKPFRAGLSVAGDPLTNTGVGFPDWGYTWAVVLPSSLTRPFRAGQGSAGDRLRLFSNTELECIINKFKPAHTIVQFIFVEE